MKFLRESLQQLDSDLRGAGSGLTLLKGVIEKEIFRLANKHDAQKMYAEKEVAPEELTTQKKVTDELLTLNCTISTFECRNLFHSSDLPFSIERLPDIFTNFRKITEKTVAVRPVFPVPSVIVSPPIAALNLTLPDELNSIDRLYSLCFLSRRWAILEVIVNMGC